MYARGVRGLPRDVPNAPTFYPTGLSGTNPGRSGTLDLPRTAACATLAVALSCVVQPLVVQHAPDADQVCMGRSPSGYTKSDPHLIQEAVVDVEVVDPAILGRTHVHVLTDVGAPLLAGDALRRA